MRFVDNGDGTVTDTQTGLMWEQGSAGHLDWITAIERCKSLDLAGHNDWRLPTLRELFSIADHDRHKPACDPVFNMRPQYYWSSSTYVDAPQCAWSVGFSAGNVLANYKTDYYTVRAVRGATR